MYKNCHITIIAIVLGIILNACCITASGGEATSNNAETGKVKFNYNDMNQLVKVIGPGNRLKSIKYNERGQIQSEKSNNSEISYEYNRLGFLKQITDDTGITKIESDSLGQIKAMTYPKGDKITYEYTEKGQLSFVNWKKRHFLVFERDLLGNIVTLKTPAGDFAMQYDYDKRFMQRKYPNGAFSQFTYNEDGRPVEIVHVAPDKKIVMKFEYTYDDTGLLEKVHEWSRNGELDINYTYDAHGQLIKASYSNGRLYEFKFDTFGNRLNAGNDLMQTTATYDEHDRLKTLNGKPVNHDAAGNVTAVGRSTYTYNANDLLLSDGKNRYKYNSLGLRIEASGNEGTFRFLHLIGNLPYVFVEKGATTKRYLWADERLLGQIEGANKVTFFFEDHLRSIRCAMDMAGNIIGYGEFSLFGVPVKRIAGVKFGFAGEEQDNDGKVYLRARYYDPKIGRFLTKDPVMPQLIAKEQQNRYAYAFNSPLNYMDRNGAYPDDIYDPFWSEDLNTIKTIYNYDYNNYENYEEMKNVIDEAKAYVDDAKNTFEYQREHPGDPAGDFKLFSFGLNTLNYFGKFSYLGVLKDPIDKLIDIGIEVRSQILHNRTKDLLDLPMGVRNQIGATTGKEYRSTHHGGFSYKGDDFSAKGNWNLWHKNNDTYGSFYRGNLSYNFQNKYLHDGTLASSDYKITETRQEIGGNFFNQYNRDSFTKTRRTTGTSHFYYNGAAVSKAIDRYNKTGIYKHPSYEFKAPNVGGVYLDKAADVIGDLSGIVGVTFDPVSNRIILIGNDAEDVKLPPLRLDDMAAAFRTVFGDYVTEPGVTIDPDPENPKAEQMKVIFFGGMENTHFGHVLFEADRIMKGLSLGEDNITHEKIGVNVQDYYNMVDLGFSNLGGTHNKDLWSRFWLVPEQVIIKVPEDRKSITFPDTRIRIKTETMKWKDGKLVPAEGEVNEKAEYFAGHFSKYYDEYAKELPIYEELKSLSNLVGVAKWMKESGVPVDLAWLKKYDKYQETDTTTPSHTVSDTRRTSEKYNETISIFGGTDLKVENFYLSDTKDADKAESKAIKDLREKYAELMPPDEYGKKALKAVSLLPGVASAEFVDSKKKKRKVVALPTSQTRSPGAKIFDEYELGLITRKYCSFHNDAGPFGHSWVIDLPKLDISQPNRGQTETVSLGNQNIEIKRFKLTRPFGMQDITFEKNIVDQQFGRIAFLPNKREGIRALYPDDKGKEYRIEYEDGVSEIFNNKGLILKKEFTKDFYRKYSYNEKTDRLVKVEVVQDGKTVSNVNLDYDKQGRIISAKVSHGKIEYSYDNNSNLIKVETKDSKVEYIYDNRHLVNEILRDGKIITSLDYDDYGRVVNNNLSEPNSLKSKIKSVEGATVVTQSIGNQEIIQKYDAGGRLLEVNYPSGDHINIKYDELGSLKVMESRNNFADINRTEYSPDNRYVKYTDAEGNVSAVLYDEFGRIKRIQKDGYAILDKNYASTKEGWMEEAETAESKSQVIFDTEMRPTKQIITSSHPQGGQIVVSNQFDENGNLERQVTTGLTNKELIYEDGRLKKTISGGNEISYTYGSKDRLSEIKSNKGDLKFAYNEKDSINNISLLINGSKEPAEVYEFSNSLLVKRTNKKGLEDEFKYDDNGVLQGVARNSGESWAINRNENKVSTLRNGIPQMVFSFDDKGRLNEMTY